MFKYRTSIYRQINIAVDTAITALSIAIALVARTYLDTGTFVAFQSYILRSLPLVLSVVILWPVLLNLNRLYPTDRLRTVNRAAKIIVKSSLQGLFVVFTFLFVFRLQDVSRLMVITFGFIVTSLLALKESIVIWRLHVLRESGANLRNVLVVGTLESACDIVNTIVENKFLGLKVIGLLVPRKEMEKKAERDYRVYYRVLGALKDIEEVIHNHPVDHVIITIDKSDYGEVKNIVSICEEEGIEIWITASIFKVKTAKLDSDELFGIPMFVFRSTPVFTWQFLMKNVIDKIGALFVGIISLPVIFLAAILIKMTSKGPIFFKQKRRGIHGREFVLYKLRTMDIDAQEKMANFQKENILKGPVFKMTDDPRVTRVGRFLRKTSIDELPQIWNVLKGDMSMVGPRPPIGLEVEQYKGWQRRRLSMKPGITGLWQVSGRTEIADFDRWVELDLKYIDNWSLALDTKIVLKTIFAILTGSGAR